MRAPTKRLFDNRIKTEKLDNASIEALATTAEAAKVAKSGELGDGASERIALLTVPELAARLKVSSSWVYKKTEDGTLPHYKVGANIRFSWEEVLQSLREFKQAV